MIPSPQNIDFDNLSVNPLASIPIPSIDHILRLFDLLERRHQQQHQRQFLRKNYIIILRSLLSSNHASHQSSQQNPFVIIFPNPVPTNLISIDADEPTQGPAILLCVSPTTRQLVSKLFLVTSSWATRMNNSHKHSLPSSPPRRLNNLSLPSCRPI